MLQGAYMDVRADECRMSCVTSEVQVRSVEHYRRLVTRNSDQDEQSLSLPRLVL